MRIQSFQLDVFTSKQFKGNPACVCLLDSWMPDCSLQQIAFENNVPATMFIQGRDNSYSARWFTAQSEIPFCGHATLGAAHVLLDHIGTQHSAVQFASSSGSVLVARKDGLLEMEFPKAELEEVPTPARVQRAFLWPDKTVPYANGKYMLVMKNQYEVTRAQPKLSYLSDLPAKKGVIITAPGDEVDFVLRYFVPSKGINEDHATGSAMQLLAPYWSERLGKKGLSGRQLSERGGEFCCQLYEHTVGVRGRAQLYSHGTILYEE